MLSVIAEYDAALADKPCLASIYDEEWRQKVRPKLLGVGNTCYLGNAFGYQAPLFERSGLVRKGWQAKLEEGASVLLPILSSRERGHLVKRMRDTESTSAEEEIFLAGGFARVFGSQAIGLPQAAVDKARPEFEVDVNGHRVLVEAKGRWTFEECEQRRKIESLLDIRIQGPPPLDDRAGQWVEEKVRKTLECKSRADSGFILILSLYTIPGNFLKLIDIVRKLAVCPDVSGLPKEHWALAIALVSGGSIQGVWFNSAVSERLGIDLTTRGRIRAAVKDSFFLRGDGVFFDEDMNDADHKAMMCKMARQ